MTYYKLFQENITYNRLDHINNKEYNKYNSKCFNDTIGGIVTRDFFKIELNLYRPTHDVIVESVTHDCFFMFHTPIRQPVFRAVQDLKAKVREKYKEE